MKPKVDWKNMSPEERQKYLKDKYEEYLIKFLEATK